MNFVLFVLSCIGLTNIIVESDISTWAGKVTRKILFTIQSWFTLLWSGFGYWNLDWLWHGLECKQCVGFWAGLITGGILVSDNGWVILTCGFASSMLATFYDLLVGYILSQSTFSLGDSNGESTNTSQ